ncbi:glutaredoxin c1 [Trifolium pratense]|uniref:Glutaredoxin c1 n=1 Tax=Trifolium pratense TaxID=57577 RepID=A0A2K3MPZ4_TRIPR|nr:glutaredoxin c1 [Trifolium pratense]
MVIDTGLGREDHGSISHNCDWKEARTSYARTDPRTRLSGPVVRVLVMKTKNIVTNQLPCDGGEIQAALADWTGQRTVPNVFIGGKHIGGCDSVLEKHRAGQLVPLLNDAGAIANNTAQF